MMMRLRKRLALLPIALSVVVVSSYAQSPDSDAFKQIALSLSQLTSNDRVVLLRSGDLVDPLRDSSDVHEQELIASQLDSTLRAAFFVTPATISLPDLYSTILTRSEWATVPLQSSLRQELNKVAALLYIDKNLVPTKGYRTYLSYRKTYDDLTKQYESTPESERTPQIQNALQQASDDLMLRGHRSLYEPSEARYQQLLSAASLSWREKDIALIKQFTRVSGTGSSFLLTETQPHIEDIQDQAWIRVTLTGAQLHHSVTQTMFPMTVEGDPPEWLRWVPLAPGIPNDCSEGIESDDFTLQFDATEIQIQRDWFDPEVFSSQAWRSSTIADGSLSDGRDEGNVGFAPFYPVGVLLVKDLRLSGSGMQKCLVSLHNAIVNHADVSVGPFKVAGTVRSSTTSFYIPPTISHAGIRVAAVQLVGFAARVFPKTPNPNSDFEWPQK